MGAAERRRTRVGWSGWTERLDGTVGWSGWTEQLAPAFMRAETLRRRIAAIWTIARTFHRSGWGGGVEHVWMGGWLGWRDGGQGGVGVEGNKIQLESCY